jgi:plasmid maintenance system antidote protein VapI
MILFPSTTPASQKVLFTFVESEPEKNMSQVKLAELTGIPQRHISEMENGKRSIGKERAKVLAKVLNCDYRMML